MVTEQHSDAHRRPAALDVLAAGLLLATVVLHVVGMFFTYYTGQQAPIDRPDEAVLFAVVAASWALALGVGLTGPHRTPIAAGLAVGVALGEIGFRIFDLGYALHYGTRSVGAGLWLMLAAWLVGALAAVLAGFAAHRRHRAPEPLVPATEAATEPAAELVAGPVAGSVVAMVDGRRERAAWSALVLVLGGLTAGAFLPAWDHGSAIGEANARTYISANLGNAFSYPWALILGNAVAAAMLLVVPLVAVRLRHKAVGAAAVGGLLLGLSAQLASAVVQVNEAVQPGQLGLSSADVSRLGLVLTIRLTGWFTVDALAAYALFAAIMVWANLRTVDAGSLPPWLAAEPPAPLGAQAEPARDPVGWP